MHKERLYLFINELQAACIMTVVLGIAIFSTGLLQIYFPLPCVFLFLLFFFWLFVYSPLHIVRNIFVIWDMYTKDIVEIQGSFCKQYLTKPLLGLDFYYYDEYKNKKLYRRTYSEIVIRSQKKATVLVCCKKLPLKFKEQYRFTIGRRSKVVLDVYNQQGQSVWPIDRFD